ncbi:MAG: PASTA domain-containing protein [Thermodesulfobacteriota bacterium]
MKAGVKYSLYAAAFFLALGMTAYATVVLLVEAPAEVEVPDLRGLDGIAALRTLSDLGLNLKVKAADFSDTVPKDHVVSQEPTPGSRLKRKRDVKVVLSKGSAAVSLPDLRGLSLAQASSILAQSRLDTGLVSYTYGQGAEQGRDRVLAQVPEPMSSVPVGTKVDLLLSLGPRPYFMAMPDLTGEPYSTALTALERAGLALGRLETQFLPTWPAETVVVQYPRPGTMVARGALVRLTINRTREADPEDYSFHLLEYQIPFGVLKREIRFRVTLGPYLWDLHEEWHGPGEKVRVLALAKGPPRGQVFEDGDLRAVFGTEENYVRSEE